MNVIIDTNVIVSGIFWKGKPRELLNLWLEGEIELRTSKAILDEYLEVIERVAGKYGKLHLAESWSIVIIERVVPVEAPKAFRGCRDPHDNMFIDCAWASRSEIVVSGDEDLLALNGVVKNVRFMTPAQALDFINKNR